jgi:hypothetical protein
MKPLIKYRFSVFVLISLFAINGCKTALAPSYDKTIVEKTNATTTELLQLFASVSDGTLKNSFDTREVTYNAIIGSFDAMAIVARARPVPTNSVTKKIAAEFKQRNLILVIDDHPSAVAFEQIVITLSKMKFKDRDMDLSKDAVGLFKGQLKVFLDQAITYENFLER